MQSDVISNNTMVFEEIDMYLPYAMHLIEEKMQMKPEDAIKKAKEEQYWIDYHKKKRTREE